MNEPLIPSKKIYFIFSGIGALLSTIAITLLFIFNNLFLNIGLSILCLLYITFFVFFYLKKEKIQPRKWSSIFGWVGLVIGISFMIAILIAAMGDDGVPLTFLSVLFLALDLTPAIYLIIKISSFFLCP
ncbi:MAG: hypothetical protein K2K48_05330 [Anaeroplasmataceae bacterium]|nr:hypothetical protein [Anaeroplasmataceae bacterium]